MDRYGYFHFSLSNSVSKAILEKAKTGIMEDNEKLPRALGGREEYIHISEVDMVVEGDNPDLIELKSSSANEVDKKVASYIVEEIADGSARKIKNQNHGEKITENHGKSRENHGEKNHGDKNHGDRYHDLLCVP